MSMNTGTENASRCLTYLASSLRKAQDMTGRTSSNRAGKLVVAIAFGFALLTLPSVAQADNWRVAPDLDDARLSIGASSGTISLNDGSLFTVPINILDWLAIAPYGVTINGPKSDVNAIGFGAAIRIQTPFGTHAHRLFWESYAGAIRGTRDKMTDGIPVDTDLRYQGISLAGVEFQVWSRLTWSLALGGATSQDDLDAIHPRFNTFNFAAQTTLRWYL